MKVNRDMSPGQVSGTITGSCLFVIAFWVAVAVAVVWMAS